MCVQNKLSVAGAAYQPEFSQPIVNLTVPLGRDATFRCLVQHLGGYRVSMVMPRVSCRMRDAGRTLNPIIDHETI